MKSTFHKNVGKIMTIREAIEGIDITSEYDYRIGFIDAEGWHDETELSAERQIVYYG